MRIIGCVAWVHIPKEKRKKLDERSKKCYLVRYGGINIFRIWNPATRKVERASHVDLDETRLMTSVSDTSYWMEEAIGDDVTDVFDAGGEAIEHHHPNVAVDPTISNVDVENIPNILGNPVREEMKIIEYSNAEIYMQLSYNSGTVYLSCALLVTFLKSDVLRLKGLAGRS